ncbi:MAG TPA: DMT family transporter [Casimicrobiaceae bacterium]|nr:DMT family transporter [Casimicrobiaceae bacterium]
MKQHHHIPLSAIALIVVSSACFTTVDVTVKILGQRYPVPLIVWARWAVQTLIIVALLGPKMKLGLVRTKRLSQHLIRGAVLIGSSVCFFTALRFLPLAEATALNYSAPILVTLMAAWLLDEHLTHARWAFVVAGFVGMLLIVRPGGDMLTPAAAFALGAALLYATFQILTRKLAGEDLMVLLVYPSLVGTVVLSLIVPLFFRGEVWYPMIDTVAFLSIGTFGFIGHFLFIRAFQRASASAIAPFTYIQLVWSTLAGWIVFGTFPDAWTLAGIVVIAGSGVLLTWYERRRANLRQSEPAAVD